MIASPSDVSVERGIAREVVAEWNSIHAKDKRIVLLPIGWETNAVPEVGDRPQSIINGQLLKGADLLIAVFWTRIGTPTVVAESGTAEEIEEHLKAGKPAMIYFSSAPVVPDDLDGGQYSALKRFKTSLGERSLYEHYKDLIDFRSKLSRQLAQKIISGFTNESGSSAPPSPPFRSSSPDLGADLRDLLIEASMDPKGVVMNLKTMQGSTVATNKRGFTEPGNPRSEATWRGAVADLAKLGLIEDRNGKGELFFVTDKGYQVADLLKHS